MKKYENMIKYKKDGFEITFTRLKRFFWLL